MELGIQLKKVLNTIAFAKRHANGARLSGGRLSKIYYMPQRLPIQQANGARAYVELVIEK